MLVDHPRAVQKNAMLQILQSYIMRSLLMDNWHVMESSVTKQ